MIAGRKLSISKHVQDVHQIEYTSSPGRCNRTSCKECYGCQHRLADLKGPVRLFNASFNFDTGQTTAKVFEVEDPTKPSPEKSSIVKIWGIPDLEVLDSQKTMHCKPSVGKDHLQVCSTL